MLMMIVIIKTVSRVELVFFRKYDGTAHHITKYNLFFPDCTMHITLLQDTYVEIKKMIGAGAASQQR